MNFPTKIYFFTMLLFGILTEAKTPYAFSAADLAFATASVAKNKKADVGIAYADSKIYWQNSGRSYPLLSVFKVHVAAAVLDKVGREHLSLETVLNIPASDLVLEMYSPMLKKYSTSGLAVSLRELLYYMVAESDNNACDILIRWVGGISEVEQYIHKLGLKKTSIKVTEADMNRNSQLQYVNRAPLADIIKLLQMIDAGNLFAPELHHELLEIMYLTATGTDKIKKYLPDSMRVAHKTGSSSRIKGRKIADNDVAIIKNGNSTFYLAIFVADSYETDTENAALIATIAKNIYKEKYKN